MSLFDDASVVITPNGQKAGKLYSIKPSDGSGDLSVTRATSATRVDANGLVEIPRTNLLTYSEQFDNANWVKSESTITVNTITAPNGTLTADKFIPSNALSGNLLGQNITSISNPSFSIYAKKGEFNYIQLLNFGTSGYANFDLENGVIGSYSESISTIENVGNGWYRCNVNFTTGALTTVRIAIVTSATSTRLQRVVGDGTSGLFIWGAQLEQGNVVTEYIPTVASIRTKFAGITQDGSSASNIPRLDYTNGSCPSILVEPQRTNILNYSEQFDNAYWTKANVTVTANYGISPDGTQNANRIQFNVANASSIYRAIGGATTDANSIYIKGVAGEKVLFGYGANIATGTLFTLTGEWQRLEQISTTGVLYHISNFSGGTASDILLWGAQREVGSYATSYIPTVAASVTRNADVISKTGISSLIGQTEGTLFIEANSFQTNLNRYITISDGTSNNYVYFRYIDSANQIWFRIVSNGVAGSVQTYSYTNPQNFIKSAIRYSNNSFDVFINGVKIISSIGVNTLSGNMSQLKFSFPDNSNNFQGNVKQLQLYKTALTDEQCINLTTL